MKKSGNFLFVPWKHNSILVRSDMRIINDDNLILGRTILKVSNRMYLTFLTYHYSLESPSYHQEVSMSR